MLLANFCRNPPLQSSSHFHQEIQDHQLKNYNELNEKALNCQHDVKNVSRTSQQMLDKPYKVFHPTLVALDFGLRPFTNSTYHSIKTVSLKQKSRQKMLIFMRPHCSRAFKQVGKFIWDFGDLAFSWSKSSHLLCPSSISFWRDYIWKSHPA